MLAVAVAAFLLVGCGGEGSIKLKATHVQVIEEGFFSDKYGEVPFSGGEYFINGKSFGVGSEGWKQVAVSPGVHKVELKILHSEEVLHVYSTEISIQDKQIEEYVFNITKMDDNDNYELELKGETKKNHLRFINDYKDIADIKLYKNGTKTNKTPHMASFKKDGSFCETNGFGSLVCNKSTIALKDKAGIVFLRFKNGHLVELTDFREYRSGCFSFKVQDMVFDGCKT